MSSDVDFLEGLSYLEEIDFPTYYSPGAHERALELAEIAKNSVHYLDEFYENKVQNRLLVLNEKDWTKRIEYQYGLIAGRNNYLWYPIHREENPVYADMIPYYENSQTSLKQKLSELLPDSKHPFLTACLMWWETYMVHEMFHNYSKANGVNISLRWFDELFGDYVNYAFLKRYHEQYQVELQVTQVYFPLLYKGGHPLVQYTSLHDLEELYGKIDGANYCWYHAWFNVGVFQLYEMYGESFIEKVNDLYKSESGFDSTIEQLVSRVNLELEGFQDWYHEWIKQKP